MPYRFQESYMTLIWAEIVDLSHGRANKDPKLI